MKRAEYKISFDVPDLLKPIELSRETGRKDAKGNPLPDKVNYQYHLLQTREAENLEEFQRELVDQADPSGNVLSLCQAQWDIQDQRKGREFLQSDECAKLCEGKDERTAHIRDADELRAKVLEIAQTVVDDYIYGARTVSATGAQTKAAKEALANQNALAKAAAEHPEVAKRLEQLNRQLAALGYGGVVPVPTAGAGA